MSKRKRGTVDDESITPGKSNKAKKQKTNTTFTPQARDSSNATIKHIESEGSVQVLHDGRSKTLDRKIAKQQRKALARAQQDESGFNDGSKTVEADGNNGLAEDQNQKSVGKEQAGNRLESQKRAKGGGHNLTIKHESEKEKRKDGNIRSSGKKSKKNHVERATWKVSDPSGGQMLDVDPVFSPDETSLLVAYGTSIAVYSTSTSLLVRQLRIKKSDCISAFAFSSTTPGHLYLSTISGTIEKWNWIEGLRLSHWKISSSIYSLVTAQQDEGDPSSDLVYTIDRQRQGPWLLSVHCLAGVEDGAKTDVKTLLTNPQALSSMKVLERGRVIVATSGTQLMFGSSDEPAPSPLKDISYVWRFIECPEHIVSTDFRIRPSGETPKMSKGEKPMANVIDIVVGGLRGSIHIYQDLLRNILQRDRPAGKENSKSITSRRLHWHRNAVHAVKWSTDGNYVISGGQETTLVLWQLETEHRQYVPHLGAAVESIIVSPSGSSYGIRLADNSAMILSTYELRPTFSIAGIQIPALRQQRMPLPFVSTVTAMTQKKGAISRSRFPVCASLTSPGHLLLAVPPATTSKQLSMTPVNASYLQSFDVGAAHQISRQALTRTKVTTLNMGPESNIIEEPNVTHVQTSSDGRWLASVDEWMPPKRDLEPLAFDQERVLEEVVSREEIYLKFWSWNVDTRVWELISRIDNPHASPCGNPYDRGGVLDLVSDPSCAAFATMGEDGVVRTWQSAIRRRNGLEVKGKDGSSLRAWHCQHATSLEMSELITGKGSLGAKLAYSQDGSILAAGLQSSMASPIYIIDTYSGEIKSVHTGIYAGPLLGLGIVHKYLVTLSDELCVYDLVDDKLNYGIDLPAHGLSHAKRIAQNHLVVDAHNSTFAIAAPQITKTGMGSQIAIFDPADASPQLVEHLPNTITTLVPVAGRNGFYAIDSAAQVRSILRGQSVLSGPMVLPEDRAEPARGLHDLFGGGQPMLTPDDMSKDFGFEGGQFGSVIDERDVNNDGAAVVSPDRLAEVFDVGPAYALPPMTELFEQVARLYFGK